MSCPAEAEDDDQLAAIGATIIAIAVFRMKSPVFGQCETVICSRTRSGRCKSIGVRVLFTDPLGRNHRVFLCGAHGFDLEKTPLCPDG